MPCLFSVDQNCCKPLGHDARVYYTRWVMKPLSFTKKNTILVFFLFLFVFDHVFSDAFGDSIYFFGDFLIVLCSI